MKREFLITIIFSLFLFLSNGVFSQTSISGVINSYTAVDSIYPTKDIIEVSNPGAFSDNDTVMVYQVKGADPQTDIIINPHNFGSPGKDDFNSAGKYEIILIQNIVGNQIIFKATLKNDYNKNDSVQLIKVPSYKSARINGELSCDAWDGGKGGILALMVSDTLFLDANINVEGKGLRGAVPFKSNGNCASEDSVLYGSYYFSENTDAISAGFKGEGIAKYDTTYSKGFGRWANGGGGGNARFSGGGGGGNGGQGGDGGAEDTLTCITPNYEGTYWTGLGGRQGFGLNLIFSDFEAINDSTMYFGGGGGSGTYTTGLSATTGGDGGGIVIIIAKVIKSNGNSIVANGASVSSVADASGAGGGAGGSVVFDIESVVGNVNVSTIGGVGGWVKKYGESGPGGGGGGGVIFYNSVRPINVGASIVGGEAGFVEELFPAEERLDANPGQPGTEKPNYNAPLTGFLFNNITSDQQVCMNSVPDLISGTEPRGGNGTFTFQWQHLSETTSGWDSIPGATERDFQPPALTDTVSYRRIVSSGSIDDYGNEVEIIVHNFVVNNEIFMPLDSVICIGNSVGDVTGTRVILGGNNDTYQYLWEYSLDSAIWKSGIGAEDTVYNHGEISDTTFIRRRVISGGCIDTASLYNPIIGLPKILNVIIPDQEICYGDSVLELSSDVLANGLGPGSFTFQWLKSADGISWTDTIGAIDSILQPPPLFDTIYYKRIVYSDDCIDTSSAVTIEVLPLIENNIIENDLPVYTCYNTNPEILLGGIPLGGRGAGTYIYQWQDSISNGEWNNITDANASDYSPGALIDTTFYRRNIISGACKDTSDFIKIGLWDLPEGSILGIIDSICTNTDHVINFYLEDTGKFPLSLFYSDGVNSNNMELNIDNPGALPYTVTPVTSNPVEVFIYTIDSILDSYGCRAVYIEGHDTITVYGQPTIDAGLNPDENCELTYQLKADLDFGTGTWIDNYASIREDQIHSPNAIVNVDTAGTFKYYWEVENEKCFERDSVIIALYERPFDLKVYHTDTTTHAITVNPTDSRILTLRQISDIELKGTYKDSSDFEVVTTWSIQEGSANPFGSYIHDSIIKFTNLDDELGNRVLILWTVEKRDCPDTALVTIIKLDEIFQPNGFTPNGDGVNDYLVFNGIEKFPNNKLIIYNRWGTEVFSQVNYSNENGWDGKNNSKNDLPEDTYFYVFRVVNDPGETRRGFIVLKRF